MGEPITVVPYWQIFRKAGFPGPLALLMVVPLAHLVVLYIVAFSRWKVMPETAYASSPYPVAPPPHVPPVA
jgi:hypothetical protein